MLTAFSAGQFPATSDQIRISVEMIINHLPPETNADTDSSDPQMVITVHPCNHIAVQAFECGIIFTGYDSPDQADRPFQHLGLQFSALFGQQVFLFLEKRLFADRQKKLIP